MIKAVFFDVGETLIHQGQAISGVPDALDAISKLKADNGSPIQMGIVSDYFLPDPPVTETKILALEQQYATTILDPTNLTEFFQPFASRVTLSTRAGVMKPDRKIFEVAINRLNAGVALNECLFVTEAPSHLQKVQDYGMHPVGFGTNLPAIPQFSKWVDAPVLFATMISPGNMNAVESPAKQVLNARDHLEDLVVQGWNGSVLHGSAKQWIQLHDPQLGSLDGVFVSRPTNVAVELTSAGVLGPAQVSPVDSEELDDMRNFVRTLVKANRIQTSEESQGKTHKIVTDTQGEKRLVLWRYSK